MITKEHLMNGLLQYVDSDVIPHLPTHGKWVVGTIVTMVSSKANDVIDSMLSNPIVQAIDVVDKNGLIDSDKLIDNLAKSADKYGSVEVVIPVVGTLRFTTADVRSLGRILNSHTVPGVPHETVPVSDGKGNVY